MNDFIEKWFGFLIVEVVLIVGFVAIVMGVIVLPATLITMGFWGQIGALAWVLVVVIPVIVAIAIE